MKKLFYILLFFLPTVVQSQTIPDDIKKTVVFIYAQNANGKLIPNGTGFFIGVENIENKETFSVYFVTAKHVLQYGADKKYLDKVYLRLNKKDSTAESKGLMLYESGINKNIYTHSDATVDIAVIPLLPSQEIYDFLFMPNNFLNSKQDYKEMNIREGSDVFFTGMFTPFLGEKKNYPITRFGRVALVTEEKIPWDNQLTDLYLVESSSYGGNSGSPVFFYLGANRGDGSLHVGPPIIKLAGIMKGYFGEKSPISVVETNKVAVSDRNIGIAAVVPAYLLQEILYSDELIEKRGLKK